MGADINQQSRYEVFDEIYEEEMRKRKSSEAGNSQWGNGLGAMARVWTLNCFIKVNESIDFGAANCEKITKTLKVHCKKNKYRGILERVKLLMKRNDTQRTIKFYKEKAYSYAY